MTLLPSIASSAICFAQNHFVLTKMPGDFKTEIFLMINWVTGNYGLSDAL